MNHLKRNHLKRPYFLISKSLLKPFSSKIKVNLEWGGEGVVCLGFSKVALVLAFESSLNNVFILTVELLVMTHFGTCLYEDISR